MQESLLMLAAVGIDLIIGDPGFFPHPVVIIGRLINFLEEKIRVLTPENTDNRVEIIEGLILVLIVLGITWGSGKILVVLAESIHPFPGFVLKLYVLSTAVAVKGLTASGYRIYDRLERDGLPEARESVGQIVGRDTDRMEEKDIIRATVESLAENTSDGIIAPLFFFWVGGIPLALTYKAVNTLDSMLGYRNEKYLYFGRAAAVIDDIINYLPARITALIFCLVSVVTGGSFRNGLRMVGRDAGKHPSLNAGYPEAAIAGILGIRLGGRNFYQGQESFRAYLGDRKRELERGDIKRVLRLIYLNLILFLSFLVFVSYFI